MREGTASSDHDPFGLDFLIRAVPRIPLGDFDSNDSSTCVHQGGRPVLGVVLTGGAPVVPLSGVVGPFVVVVESFVVVSEITKSTNSLIKFQTKFPKL